MLKRSMEELRRDDASLSPTKNPSELPVEDRISTDGDTKDVEVPDSNKGRSSSEPKSHNQMYSLPGSVGDTDPDSEFRKRDRRLAMNRVTARERRRRKKQHLEDLEIEVGNLQTMADNLRRENQLLRASIAKLSSSMRNAPKFQIGSAGGSVAQAISNSTLNFDHGLGKAPGFSNSTALSTQLLINQLQQARHITAMQSMMQGGVSNGGALASPAHQVTAINNSTPLHSTIAATLNLQERLHAGELMKQSIDLHQRNQSTLKNFSRVTGAQHQNDTSMPLEAAALSMSMALQQQVSRTLPLTEPNPSAPVNLPTMSPRDYSNADDKNQGQG